MRKYLVADDSKAIRQTLLSFLRQIGVQENTIFTAEDGDQSLEVFRKENPEVVFLDLEMPKQDGVTVGTIILGEKPDTKVVITTSVPEGDPRLRATLELGVFAVLQKPLRLDAVQRVIRLLDQEGGSLKRVG